MADAAAEPAAGAADVSGGVPQRCVVVLGTGRSGSTSLADALNQLPNYLIRGEQEGAYWYLYLAWRMLESAWSHSTDYRESSAELEAEVGPGAASRPSFHFVKGVYDRTAVRRKLPWFNDLHPERLLEAVRGFYNATYGYHGPGVVSGFKDIRFVRGRAFPSADSTYADFANFLAFLRRMCGDVKFLLNSRASSSQDANKKLMNMLDLPESERKGFVQDLRETHAWYDRYAAQNPDHAFRIHMEAMFDPKINGTMARRLLAFLGEDPDTPISFARMPKWCGGKHSRSKWAASDLGPGSASASAPGSTPRTLRPPRQPPSLWHLRRRQLAQWVRGVADRIQGADL
ncbi:hypothetical protein GPECTOR_9g534 [Gonium pectorale]|uniref:Sulfotransferase n=1 Tax=Gonium pectorale TaxID=33097 RepID=A0A150GT31_GONPE|nr:hypothetical protein GPECTOR_9g534 [Gonium pectorale]|eukprot:KXZ52490.1 hypothetical protein GPECTOR_9g534 [Gonium pectorale]